MMMLEPRVNSAMAKLDKITTLPTPSQVRSNEIQTQKIMKKIDDQTDGAKVVQKVQASKPVEEKSGGQLKDVKKAVESVKASVKNKDTKAAVSALKETIKQSDALAKKFEKTPPAPNRVVPLSGSGADFLSSNVTNQPSLDKIPVFEQPKQSVEQSMSRPIEQEKITQTIKDTLENEGIWTKNAEVNKEIADEVLKQTREMAKKEVKAPSKWASKEGLKQVKDVLAK